MENLQCYTLSLKWTTFILQGSFKLSKKSSRTELFPSCRIIVIVWYYDNKNDKISPILSIISLMLIRMEDDTVIQITFSNCNEINASGARFFNSICWWSLAANTTAPIVVSFRVSLGLAGSSGPADDGFRFLKNKWWHQLVSWRMIRILQVKEGTYLL